MTTQRERKVFRDEAEIVIVREGWFKYRWTCSIKTGGRRIDKGTAWTARGARSGAMSRVNGFLGSSFIGRVEREEIRVAARMSTAPFRDDPDPLPTELLDG